MNDRVVRKEKPNTFTFRSQRGRRNVHIEVVTRIKSLLKRGKGKVTPGDHKAPAAQCVENAEEAKTLTRLAKGIWFCCVAGKSDDGCDEWGLTFIYRVIAGPTKYTSDLFAFFLDYVPSEFHWELTEDPIDLIVHNEPDRAILRALSNNRRRTILARPGPQSKNTIQVLKVIVRRIRQ